MQRLSYRTETVLSNNITRNTWLGWLLLLMKFSTLSSAVCTLFPNFLANTNFTWHFPSHPIPVIFYSLLRIIVAAAAAAEVLFESPAILAKAHEDFFH